MRNVFKRPWAGNGSVALLLSILSSIWLVAACSWTKSSQHSVLVIMVENLGFNVISCNESHEGADEEEGRGFQDFCRESVRFTHAFTPSTMSQATVASLLTAQYPFQHGVRHNGSHALSAAVTTLSEEALQKKYRTGFFSGGPPIFRKSGFSQGFEFFDDGWQTSLSRLYRPASEVMSTFLDWQETEVKDSDFMSFLFLSDLQFIDLPTTNASGELREISYRSQLQEVGESLAYLVKEMKRRKIWDGTDLFLVGLNGYAAGTRFDQIPASNLFSESTRVTLMIKPSRKLRDGPFNWKVDSNVSLTDVGATLFSLIGAIPSKAKRFTGVDVVSLRETMTGPEPDWDENRMLISESGWTQWRGLGGIRAAARRGPYLYVFDEHELLFNTLTDNFELAPLPDSDARFNGIRDEFSNFLGELGYVPWDGYDRRETEKFDLAKDLWSNRLPRGETFEYLRSLSRRYPQDEELLGWRAIWSLRTEDWHGLREAALQANRPLWQYVADRNLKQRAEIPEEPCLEFLLRKRREYRLNKRCQAEGIDKLLLWARGDREQSLRDRAMENFIRLYSVKVLRSRIAELNYATSLQWDVASPRIREPEMIDLLLALPELRTQKSILRRRIEALSAR